jgi:Flp pilus assembly protein TadB
MPAVFLGLLFVMDADSTSLLFTTTPGVIIITIVMIFNILGHLWIKKILNVDV